jgi:hypothetical protein
MSMRLHKAIRKAGKSSPAVFAFSDPRPLLRDFTKNIAAKAKPSTSTNPILGLRAEGFRKPMSSEPALSHRPWISTLGATQHVGLYPIMPSYKLTRGEQDSFDRLKVLSCRMRSDEGKTTLERQNARAKAQTEGCYRSTEFEIVVPRSSCRKIFCQNTSSQQKAEKGETGKSFEQQPI